MNYVFLIVRLKLKGLFLGKITPKRTARRKTRKKLTDNVALNF